MATQQRASRKLKRGMPFHPDEVRRKIRATELVNRLQSHIFDGLELSMSQVHAICALLRKCVPDLSATTVTADINVRYVAHLPEPISREAWLAKYGGDYLDPARTIEGHVNGGGNGKAGDEILQ